MSIKEKTLLLTHPHFQSALEEAKDVARFYSTYFEDNKFTNETREPATNITLF